MGLTLEAFKDTREGTFMSAVFEFQRVTKRFGKQTALDAVSFRGDQGEVIALLGENGAGKTTALKILMGLLPPDDGMASVMGMDSRIHGAEIRRRVGYMPDRPALYDWMTVSEIGWFAAGFVFRIQFQALADVGLGLIPSNGHIIGLEFAHDFQRHGRETKDAAGRRTIFGRQVRHGVITTVKDALTIYDGQLFLRLLTRSSLSHYL